MGGTESQRMNSGSLYWQSTMSHIPSYPALKERVITHAAIIGGGMTGALCSSLLAHGELPCVLVEEQQVAGGAMESNAGLLQFSNGRMLNELAQLIGETEAVRFYGECRKASTSLSVVARQLPFKTGFHMRSSLYCASTADDVPKLFKEYSILRKHGFAVEWGSAHAAGHQLPIRKPAALVTHGDAEMNPVRFAHSLIAEAKSLGAHVFENTPVRKVERRNGRFIISTDSGEIIANCIVHAGGHVPDIEYPTLNQPVKKRSFTVATSANSLPVGWPYDCMMRETAQPDFFFRTTPDRRIIAGGSDKEAIGPITESNYLANRRGLLVSELSRLFPDNKWHVEYAWSGSFYESKEILPVIGEYDEHPGIFHAQGFGANGTVYSMIAAKMLLNYLLGREHSLTSLLSKQDPGMRSTKASTFKMSY